MICTNTHEYEGLACPLCAADKSLRVQLDIAEDVIRSGAMRPRTNGEHYSLSRDEWNRLFDQYGWRKQDASVPALCGAPMPLRELDAKKLVDECKCAQCAGRVRELSRS